MSVKHSLSSRRRFLRSQSALIALPLLESFGLRTSKSLAESTEPVPKRLIYLGTGFGFTQESWYPDQATTGRNYSLSTGLAPLARFKDDITVIQNLSNQYSNEAHWGSTFWLTGADRYAIAGRSFHNSVSVDQVAAEVLGKTTRFTSIQLGYEGGLSGHGPGLSLAWNRQGKPVSGFNTPLAAFHRLFSAERTPLAQRQYELRKKRSLLDTVLEDAKSAKRVMTATDRDKIDEYFQSIREIETRLAKEEKWLSVPKRKPEEPLREPAEGIEGVEEVKVMYDLMIAAMQVDACRVFTYRQPQDSFVRSLGATITAHTMSHYGNDDRRRVSEQRDVKQSELLGHFIHRLKTTREIDGSTLFDHTTLTMGSNIHSIHYLTNCPTVVTGGGSGMNHGRHLVMPRKTPLCNLWLSQLRGTGINVDQHGDSTGVIDALFT